MPELDAFGFVVDDMDATLDFYRALGLEIAPDQGADHVEAMLPSGVRVMWDSVATVTSFNPDWTPPAGSSRSALAFRCTDAAEVDSTYHRMVEAGHDGHLAPWDAPWGQRYASLNDPSGITVDLYAPL